MAVPSLGGKLRDLLLCVRSTESDWERVVKTFMARPYVFVGVANLKQLRIPIGLTGRMV